MADEKILNPSGVEKEPVLKPSRIEEVTLPSSGLDKESIAREGGSAPPEQVLKHAYDADEAMKAFAEGEVEIIDEATNRRLLRRIDLNIMPVSRGLLEWLNGH